MRAMYTVLIADDEAIVRMMLSSMIDWDEMELKLAACVSNGREALAYLEQHPVDILITYIHMPVIYGLELISRVNSIPSRKSWFSAHTMIFPMFARPLNWESTITV